MFDQRVLLPWKVRLMTHPDRYSSVAAGRRRPETTSVALQRVVVFDLDGTLMPHATSSGVIADAIGHGSAYKALELRYSAGDVSNAEVTDRQAAWFAGLALADVHRTLQHGPWIEGLGETLSALADAGCRLLLATLAWRFVADMLAERYPFDAVCGAEMAIHDATLTGTVDRYFDEHDKLRFVACWCADNGYSLQDVVAIGDSRSDLPLFRHAAASIALNATDEARAAAGQVIDTDDLRDLLPMLVKPSGIEHGSDAARVGAERTRRLPDGDCAAWSEAVEGAVRRLRSGGRGPMSLGLRSVAHQSVLHRPYVRWNYRLSAQARERYFALGGWRVDAVPSAGPPGRPRLAGP